MELCCNWLKPFFFISAVVILPLRAGCQTNLEDTSSPRWPHNSLAQMGHLSVESGGQWRASGILIHQIVFGSHACSELKTFQLC